MARIERQEVSNKVHIHCLILITLQWFVVVYEANRIGVTIMRQSYSATNWQQEVCHFQNALNSPSCFYPICFKTSSEYCKTRPM